MTENNQFPEQDFGEASEPKKIESIPAYEKDQHFYRVVVWSLSLTVLLSILGSLVCRPILIKRYRMALFLSDQLL